MNVFIGSHKLQNLPKNKLCQVIIKIYKQHFLHFINLITFLQKKLHFILKMYIHTNHLLNKLLIFSLCNSQNYPKIDNIT